MSSLSEKLAAAPLPTSKTVADQASGTLEFDRVKDTFDPYTRVPTEHAASSKRDLRKLSEWIKMMKALEERKKRGEEE